MNLTARTLDWIGFNICFILPMMLVLVIFYDVMMSDDDEKDEVDVSKGSSGKYMIIAQISKKEVWYSSRYLIFEKLKFPCSARRQILSP